MKTLVIDARNLSGSSGRYIRELLSNLENIISSFNIVVIINKKDESFWKSNSSNFKLNVSNAPPYSWREQTLLAWELYRIKPDLVHFWMPQQPLLYRGKKVTSILDANLTKIDNSRGGVSRIIFKLKQSVFRYLFKRVARTSRAVITISNYSKQDIVDYTGISPDKVYVTYLGATVLPKPTAVKKLVGKKFIMYVGQSSPYKGQKQLIEAHQLLLNDHPNLQLAIGGKPNKFTHDNQKWAQKQGYKNIHWLGYISDTELNWLYQHTACYVCPSQMEGFGLNNIEAMLAGAPVASSNATCLPEISGPAASYFDPLDPADMAQAIDKVISDPNFAKKLIVLGKKQASKYSWQKTAKQTLEVYNRVLEENQL